MALAAVRLGVGDAALARLGGADGAAARAVVAGGGAAALRDELAAVRPAGWRMIDPSWLDGPAAEDRYRARIAYGALVPMGDHPLVALEPAALVRALAAIGRTQLAHALVGSAPRSIAELAARLPWGRALLGEVASIHALGAAAETRLGSRAAAAARCAGLVWSDPLALPRAGARAIARLVAGEPDLPQQLAQRLARPVGTVLLGDLRAFATSPGLPRLP
jgi:hypothetical protein